MKLQKCFAVMVAIALMLSALLTQAQTASAISESIVISQVYGGGGNTGAPYRNDYVELFNRSSVPVSLNGMSVQYASATGTGNFGTNPITLLSGTLAPGQYYLVQMSGGTNGVPLPTPDAVGSANMSGTAGKVVLVNTTAGLTCNGGSAPCSPAQLALIIDLVGYGTTANFSETSPAPAPSNTTSIFRNSDGCIETDNNAADFTAGAPAPRNTSSPLNLCSGGDSAPMVSNTIPASGATNVARAADIIITFSEPVNVTDGAFNLSCSNSGPHSFVLTGGPTSFTLNPDVDFNANEQCTVTITASGISDQDGNDPPDTMTVDFTTGFTTIDAQVCGDPATYIHDVQGNGPTSPIVGQTVSIEGVVVADFQGPGQFSGYYVQEETADVDADFATSEGIFVFNTSFPVSVGDKVRVRGNVFEFLSSGQTLTELTSVNNVLICSSGNNLPEPTLVTLPVSALTDWERYEGMLINIPQDLTVTETFTLGRFGDVTLSVNGRLLNPTSIAAPGAPAIDQQDLNDRSRILLDDANNNQNIDPTLYPSGGLSASNTLRSGYTVYGLTGLLEQRFGLYRVQPVGPLNFDPTNLRSAAPEDVGGTIKVASFNLLNYFNGDGMGGGFPTARGANTQFEFDRQRTKTINAIFTMDADIIGLMEMENDPAGNSAIEDLVNGLNAAAGQLMYGFINTGVVGTDEIRVGLIYDTTTVTPVGSYAILDSTVDPTFLDTKNRPVLAQTFMQNSNGARLTVAVNHLKSKGSDCNDVGDPDIGDGQGNCNLTRTYAANALVNWLAGDPTGVGDTDYIIIGDLNSYAMEDPITAIRAAGYTDLIQTYLGSSAYSYVFSGQSGYLDHALASSTLVPQVTGVTEWHINADEPIALDYNVEFKSANHVNTLYAPDAYRSSDHDPVIVGLNLLNYSPELGDITAPVTPVAVGSTVNISVPFTDPDALDTHTAVIDWGDGMTTAGDVVENWGAGQITGSHIYNAPGIYTITVTVADNYGNMDEATFMYVVVYDPNGSFVTGGGWIDSPAGAYFADPSLVGKATFGFVAKYKKGANVPDGNTEFHFNAGGLNFKSTSYQWLVVAGSKAQFKGVGSINGEGEYLFMIFAVDGKPDTFRIRIWYENAGTEQIIYDNGSQQALGGGSIAIHK